MINEDKKLKKVSLICWIISSVVLCIAVIFQLVFQSIAILNIISTIFVAISSGIFGSAFVLWFSKKYEIKKMKREIEKEYLYIAFDLNNIIYKIQPILKGNREAVLSYSEFKDNKYLWNDLQKKYLQLEELGVESEEMQIIKNINDLFKEVIALIRYNATMTSLIGEDVKNNDAFLINEKKIFKIEKYENRTRYWSPSKNIMDKIIELEKKLLDKETIKPILYPSADVTLD